MKSITLPLRRSTSFANHPGHRLTVVVAATGLLLGACTLGSSDDGATSSEDATSDPSDADAGMTDTGTSNGSNGTTAQGGTTDHGGTTSGVDDSTGNDDEPDSGSETGGPPTDCNDPQELPPAPVDCSGADGVLTDHAFIEPGGADPSILEGVRRVEGSIRVNRIELDNLDFMACVEEVTGDVTIYGNDQLTNVDGLWSLTSIGTDFVFSDNNVITDFDGLPNLVTVPRNLVMKNNLALQSVSGFHQLEEVGDNLLIQHNDLLQSVDGLGGLHTMGGVFAITANPSLCISSVNCVGLGITDPATPPETWSTQANDFGC